MTEVCGNCGYYDAPTSYCFASSSHRSKDAEACADFGRRSDLDFIPCVQEQLGRRTMSKHVWKTIEEIKGPGSILEPPFEPLPRLAPSYRELLVTQRLMAWERAKAELYSILATYHEQTEEFDIIETHIGEFVERMEDRL